MKKMANKKGGSFLALSLMVALGALATLVPGIVSADSIGQLSTGWGDQANSLQTFAVLAVGAVGFAMVGYGIYKGTKGAQDDQQVKPMQMFGIALAGALMVASVTMTDVFQDTFGIDGAAETADLDSYDDAR